MTKNVTTVKILDSNYKIACPAEEADAVKQAALFLDERLTLNLFVGLVLIVLGAFLVNNK